MSESEMSAVIETLRQEVRALQERVGVVEDGFDVIEDGLSQSPTAAPEVDDTAEAGSDEAQEQWDEKAMVPDLSVLIPWVQANITSWCERQATSASGGGTRGVQWCSQWHEHPEAITRLWLVRAAQIDAVANGPVAVSAYLRDHFDHHMSVLTDAKGPFHNCTWEKHLKETVRGGGRYLPTAPSARVLHELPTPESPTR